MMNGKQSAETVIRLKKIEGQIRGIINMIESERYCIDILSQTRAVTSAIKRVEDKIMESHLRTCVTDSMQNGDREDRNQKIEEIMDVFAKMRK